MSKTFFSHKIKDGGYNNITNTNKVSPTQKYDIFLLSPIDNLDDDCWSTFTFLCTYIGYNTLTLPKKALIFLSNAWGV